MTFNRFIVAGVVVGCLVGRFFPAVAAPPNPLVSEKSHVKADLISEVNSIQPGGAFWAAVRLRMSPQWHTYWRNPGDSGLPTIIRWKLPKGFVAGPVHWPKPEIIGEPPVVSYGYSGEVLLLSQITPSTSLSSDTPVRLEARVDWMECADVCVPGSDVVSLTLPVRQILSSDPQRAGIFAEARADLPIEMEEWKVRVFRTENHYRLEISPLSDRFSIPNDAYFFPYEQGIVDPSKPQKAVLTDSAVVLQVPQVSVSTFTASHLNGILVSQNGWRGPGSEGSLEIHAPIEAGVDAAASVSIALILLFAFIGGILLNFMPCVLPVLGIKILGFVKNAGGDRGETRIHSLLFSGGIVVSFWVLLGVLLVLRFGGEQLGWGFQLQSPLFVGLLGILFFLFALNLFGVFEIGENLVGLGTVASGQTGRSGAFWGGVLATTVATPCTAPFMGSALGFALAANNWIISFSIFTSLALGMSSPYLVLSAYPAFIRFIPKPGKWMMYLKYFFGFLLLATVAWLLTVMASQVSTPTLWKYLAVFVPLGLAAWVYGRWGTVLNDPKIRVLARILAFSILALSIAWISTSVRTRDTSSSIDPVGPQYWEPYSENLVNEARTRGEPVFIDFTATWCLTCMVNERVVLNTDEVQSAFQKAGVRLFKADWTRYDSGITKALAEFGRASVPLYVYYAPGSKAEVLPTLLTKSIILETISARKGAKQ